jgi:multidrug efflux system membrane fusion protein
MSEHHAPPERPRGRGEDMQAVTWIALGTIILLGAGCTQTETPHTPVEHHAQMVAGTPVVTDVDVTTLALQTIPETLEAIGTVRARTQSVLSSRLVAQVVAVHVTEGERVEAGQVLVELDDRDVRAQLQRAEAGLREARHALEEVEQGIRAAQSGIAAAQAQKEVAQATQGRFAILLERRSVAPQEYDEVAARAKATAAQAARAVEEKAALLAKKQQVLARIEQAQAEVANAQVIVGYTTIRSPTHGMVAHKAVEVGNLATPGLPLCAIDVEQYRLEASVQEAKIGQIRVGQEVTVSIDALGAQSVLGTVDEIVPVADPLSRTFTVKINLPPRAELRSGLYGKAHFPVGERQALMIPRRAVSIRGQIEAVFVVDADNIVHLRLVQIGKSYGDNVEVLSGLQAGERVITDGIERVTDGSRMEGQA